MITETTIKNIVTTLGFDKHEKINWDEIGKYVDFALEAFCKTRECLEVQFDNQKRIVGAKKAKALGKDEFCKRVLCYQVLATKINMKDGMEAFVKTLAGCAIPENIVNKELSALKSITELSSELIPVMNKDAATCLHELIHELIHVLANPEYVATLRGNPITDSDEAINEFFARMVSWVAIRDEQLKCKEYAKLIGIPDLYTDRIKMVNKDDHKELQLLKGSVIVSKALIYNGNIDSIKILAKEYFK